VKLFGENAPKVLIFDRSYNKFVQDNKFIKNAFETAVHT
jgi:hypothetical protein